MPLYDYFCTSCLLEFTELCRYEDKKFIRCPDCNSNSVCEKPTAGVVLNRKKGEVNK